MARRARFCAPLAGCVARRNAPEGLYLRTPVLDYIFARLCGTPFPLLRAAAAFLLAPAAPRCACVRRRSPAGRGARSFAVQGGGGGTPRRVPRRGVPPPHSVRAGPWGGRPWRPQIFKIDLEFSKFIDFPFFDFLIFMFFSITIVVILAATVFTK